MGFKDPVTQNPDEQLLGQVYINQRLQKLTQSLQLPTLQPEDPQHVWHWAHKARSSGNRALDLSRT